MAPLRLVPGLLAAVALMIAHPVTAQLMDTFLAASAGACPNHRVYDPLSDRVYAIPETPAGQSYHSPRACWTNGRPFVGLDCVVRNGAQVATWSRFEPNQGCNFSDMTTSSATSCLKQLRFADLGNEPLRSVLERTLQVTQRAWTLTALDVIYITDIIQSGLESQRVSASCAAQILQLADTLIGVNDTTLQEARWRGNATNRLALSLERLGHRAELGNDQSLRLVSPSTGLQIWSLSHSGNDGNMIVGLEHRPTTGTRGAVLRKEDLVPLFEDDEVDVNNTDAAIVLPAEFLKNVTEENRGKDVRLTLLVFANTALFENASLESRQSERKRDTRLNSLVVSASITVNGQPITDLGGYNVTTVFLPLWTRTDEGEHVEHTRCVFWKWSGEEGGGEGGDGGAAAWSSEGCTSQSHRQGRDVCSFSHLTNFAVLMDLYGQSELAEDHHSALTIITTVGLTLSIAGLSLTVLAFLAIRKLRQGRRQQVLFNLSLSMLLSWVVFLAGFNAALHDNHVTCVAVAALLHYVIMTSFMWMLMEGLLAYLMLVRVFDATFSRYMFKTTLTAWGLPLCPVIVVLAVDPNLYNGGEQFCWLALQPFYLAFLLPVAAVMATNIVVYVLVVISIHRRGALTSGATAAHRHTSHQRAVGLRASVAMFVVLGLSWLLAFFAIEDARVVFQYLFTITTSLQGFFVFLVFTARSSEVRGFLRHLTRCKASSSSSAGRRGSSTTSPTVTMSEEMKQSKHLSRATSY